MQAIFHTTNKSGSTAYTLVGTKEEIAAYKKAKGSYYRETEDGKPLYFTSRPLSSETNYTLDKAGYLSANDTAKAQQIKNALASVAGTSLNDLQKYASMVQAGLV